MPVKIPDLLPAKSILEDENIFVMTEHRAMHQDIRPLNVIILNLMPTKIETETQLLRKLSNSPLQVVVEFMQTASYTPTHTDVNHLESFYTTFEDVKDRYFDGMIITGAPLDDVKYEDVEYWDELCRIMDWSQKHVHCTMHLCWGAFAALYHRYGIRSVRYRQKLSGVFPNRVLMKRSPLFRGFDDEYMAPHSRKIGLSTLDILAFDDLELMSDSCWGGPVIVKDEPSKNFYILCHLEYDRNTLKDEYERDVARGLGPAVPKNYFPDDDPAKTPVVRWRSAAQLLFSNWLNYYVYQTVPYDITEMVELDGDALS